MTDVGSARVEVTGDVRNFARQTERDLDRALGRMKDTKVKVGVDVDSDRANRSFTELGKSAVQKITGLISQGFSGLGSILAPVAGAAGAALGGTLAAALAAVVVPALAAALTSVAGLGLGAGLLGLGAYALRDVKALQKAVTDLGDTLDSVLRRAAGPLIKPFQDAIRSVTTLVKDLGPTLGSIFGQLAPVVKPLTQALGDLVKNALGGLQAAMPGIVAVFNGFAAALPAVGTALGDFFRTIFSNSNVLDNTTEALTLLITGPLKLLGPAISGLTVIFGALNNALILLGQGWEPLRTAVTDFINSSGALTRVQEAWRPVGDAIQVVWDKIKAFAGEDDASKLSIRMDELVQSIKDAWTELKPFLDTALSEAWGVIQEKWDEIVVPWWNDTAKPWLEEALAAAFDSAVSIAKEKVGEKLEELKNAAVDKVKGIPGAIAGALSDLGSRVRQKFTDAVNAAKQKAQELLDGAVRKIGELPGKVGSKLGEVKGKVTGAFSGAGSWLRDAGERIINGLVDAISAGFNRVKNILGDLTAMLPDWKGPASVDDRILEDAGQRVIGGFERGMASRFASVRKTLGDLTGDLPTFTAGTVRGGDGAAAAGGSLHIGEIHVHVSGPDGRRAGEEAAFAILDRLASAPR